MPCGCLAGACLCEAIGKKLVVIDVLIPRMGGYKRWERSGELAEGVAATMAAELRTLGFKVQVAKPSDPMPGKPPVRRKATNRRRVTP